MRHQVTWGTAVVCSRECWVTGEMGVGWETGSKRPGRVEWSVE